MQTECRIFNENIRISNQQLRKLYNIAKYMDIPEFSVIYT